MKYQAQSQTRIGHKRVAAHANAPDHPPQSRDHEAMLYQSPAFSERRESWVTSRILSHHVSTAPKGLVDERLLFVKQR